MSSSTPKEIPPPARDADGTKIEMRPFYDEKDLRSVRYIFYSTYYDLVPRGVRLLLLNPLVTGTWVAITAFLFWFIPQQLADLGWSAAFITGAKIVLAIGCLGCGILALTWYVDRVMVGPRVMEALDYDLADNLGEYYRKDNGQFWVFTIGDRQVGCIGVDCHQEPVMRKVVSAEKPNLAASEDIQNAEWKRTAYVMARIDDAVRTTAMTFDQWIRGKPASQEPTVLYKAHKKNEASIRRLAVLLEVQKKGLSTPLLKRAAFWAHAHEKDYLYAETNELEERLADILSKRHGYTLESVTRTGRFIGYKKLWKLDVKLWMSKELERRNREKEEEDQKKEEEELKEYS